MMRRLTLDRIAKLWAAEADQVGIQSEDIADDLVEVALSGEFEFAAPPMAAILENYDVRLGVIVGTFTRDGQPVTAGQLRSYMEARKKASGPSAGNARRLLARDIEVHLKEFRRWCNHPGFVEWAQPRGLSSPRFVEESSVIDAPKHDEGREIATDTRRVGRPSLKPEIQTAYQSLVKDGGIKHPTSVASCVPRIRERVRKNNPHLTGNKGLGREAIRQAILSEFDENQRAAKVAAVSP